MPLRSYLRAKIHNATVTEANVAYVGSVTIDETLMRKAGIDEWERVLVVDNTNGERLETYVIRGEPGSGSIAINGGAARRIRKGDQVILMTFHLTARPTRPRCVLVDAENRFVRYLKERASVELC